MRAASPGSVVLMLPNLLYSAEFVVKLQRRDLDGDPGNSARRRSEAAVERIEIGQSAGIEFGVNGLGEIGFARPITSECQ